MQWPWKRASSQDQLLVSWCGQALAYVEAVSVAGRFRVQRMGVVQQDQDKPKEFFDPDILWVDLAQHLERLWGNFELAVRLHSPTNAYPERFASVRGKIAEWRKIDPHPAKI